MQAAIEAIHSYALICLTSPNGVRLLFEAGYPLGLASSSTGELIGQVVDQLGIRPYLRVLQSAEHEPYGKPHPAVYIEAARRLERVRLQEFEI